MYFILFFIFNYNFILMNFEFLIITIFIRNLKKKKNHLKYLKKHKNLIFNYNLIQ